MFLKNKKDNGGRKDRRLLLNDKTLDMDMMKVADWVKNGKLDSRLMDTGPKGQVNTK